MQQPHEHILTEEQGRILHLSNVQSQPREFLQVSSSGLGRIIGNKYKPFALHGIASVFTTFRSWHIPLVPPSQHAIRWIVPMHRALRVSKRLLSL